MLGAESLELLLALALGLALWAGWMLRGIWEALGARRHRAETEAVVAAAEARARDAEAALAARVAAPAPADASPEGRITKPEDAAPLSPDVPDDNHSTAR
ncbi:MAG: hypothetical protein AAFP17_01730 [Pseudomonadota bacterium]